MADLSLSQRCVPFQLEKLPCPLYLKEDREGSFTLSSIKSTRRFSSLCRWFISRYSINGINKTIYNIPRFIQRGWRLLLWKCFIDFSGVSLSLSFLGKEDRYNDQSPFHFFLFFILFPFIPIFQFFPVDEETERESLSFFRHILFQNCKRKERRVEKEKQIMSIFNILTISSSDSRNSLIPLYNLLY